MQNRKKALIIEGGGSRGVFSFGVIDSFIKASYNPFDIHLGVSNGAVVQLWYLLAVSDYNLDKMLFSASRDYVRYSNLLFNKSIMNFEKLYQDANKVFPIDFDRLQDNLAGKNFYVVVSDAGSGKPEYIQLSKENYINEMLATGSLPVLMKNAILLEGKRKYDGGITDPIPVQKAYEMGAKEIVIIRTYEQAFIRKTKLENYIAAFATRSYPNISKALKENTTTYNSALEFINNPPSDCKILQICPPQRLSTKRATTNVNIMKADYQIGMNCGEEFLEKYL
ncbi:MAG: patatin-like phospholipase family protein [Gammaproteobacteria bacterium]|jgi:predicted patatin/cPLA2 family phospholipase|tara:strand:+ start:71 stop:913 length:843 start_codon:yes stop_codon:yes gene_type:complete